MKRVGDVSFNALNRAWLQFGADRRRMHWPLANFTMNTLTFYRSPVA